MRSWVLVASMLLAVSSCSSSGGGGGESSCPLALELGGRTYYAMKTEERVTGSGSLAEVRFAPCDDGSGIPAGDRSARFDAQRLDGIDPTVAFAVPSQWPRRVFVTGPVDGSSLPAEVERLLNY